METTVVIALIALVSTMCGLIWKMWADHTNLTRSVVIIVQQNTKATVRQANASDKVAKSVEENTRASREQAKVLAQHKEVLSGLALRALTPRVRKSDITPAKKQIKLKRRQNDK